RDEVVLQIITTIDPVTEGDLARLLDLRLSTVAELIRRLVELGAVLKPEKGEHDSRQKPLKLSAYGKQLVEAVRAYVVDAAGYLTKGFDADKLKNALALFQDMQRNA